jgi:hypothetical protein
MMLLLFLLTVPQGIQGPRGFNGTGHVTIHVIPLGHDGWNLNFQGTGPGTYNITAGYINFNAINGTLCLSAIAKERNASTIRTNDKGSNNKMCELL